MAVASNAKAIGPAYDIIHIVLPVACMDFIGSPYFTWISYGLFKGLFVFYPH